MCLGVVFFRKSLKATGHQSVNEVNTIPLQLQINFTELREDIRGL